jgi:hypothetical protein
MMVASCHMSKHKARAQANEVAELKATLEEILRQASKRFEGQSCPRCLAIESLAADALRSNGHDKTNPIALPELNALLERKRK